MSGNIDKTVKRVNQFIQDQQFYEAHQAVRTVITRYVRQRDYDSAIGLLYSSALLLASANQTGSSSDLLLYMLDIYEKHNIPVDNSSKGRIASIVYQLNPSDPILKQLAIRAVTKWSHNDSDLAHVFGKQLLHGGDLNEGEKYLLVGNTDSARLLAEVHKQLAQAYAERLNSEKVEFPNKNLLVRGVIGYLNNHSIRNAFEYLKASNESGLSPLYLLVETCQTKNQQLYKRLLDNEPYLKNMSGMLDRIERDYFSIIPYKQPNLADLMGSLLNPSI